MLISHANEQRLFSCFSGEQYRASERLQFYWYVACTVEARSLNKDCKPDTTSKDVYA